jgi:hypothetical protein
VITAKLGSAVVPEAATRGVRFSGPARIADDTAKVASDEARFLVGDHVGLDVPECRLRLVPDAVVERLDDVFLEGGRARKDRDDGLPLRLALLAVGQAENVHLHAGSSTAFVKLVYCNPCYVRSYAIERVRADLLDWDTPCMRSNTASIHPADLYPTWSRRAALGGVM